MDDFEHQLRSGLVDLANRVEPSGQLRERVLRPGRHGRHESHARRRRWSITVAVGAVAATALVGGRLWTTSDSTDTRVSTNPASEAGPPPNLRIVVGKEIVEQSPDGSRRVLAHLPEFPRAAVSVGDEVLGFRVGALDRVELSDASVDTLAVPYCQNAGVQCGDLLKTPDGTAVVYTYDTVGSFPEGSVQDATLEYRASKVSHIALYREGETRELATIPVGVHLISFSPDGSSLWLYPHINPKEAEVIDGSRREDLVPRRLLQLDVATGAVRSFALEGQPGWILVSPDGSRLVTGSFSSAGTTFRLYDLTAEKTSPLWEKLQPQAPRSQRGGVSLSGVLWSPDGGSIYFGLNRIADQTAGVDDGVVGVWRLDADTGGLTRVSLVTGELGYLSDDGRWLLLRELEVKRSVAGGVSISAGNQADWLDVADGTVVPVTLPLDAIVVDWPPQREFGKRFIS